ncbi:hypothetical protein A2U01_0000244 [Trifolium medium]|uniref:Uncharacterized protein n=3 Tax=Trifolium TaxID=3898 RepID=A0A392LXX2_9FABA|nr:hypothetical protein [Trifolium medium]
MRPAMDHPRNKGRKKAPIGSVKRPVTGKVVLRPAWDNLWDEARFSGNLDSVYGAFSNEHENKLIEVAIKQTLEEREATRPFTGEGVKRPARDNLWDEARISGNLDSEYKWMKEAIKLALEEREAIRKRLKKCMDEEAEMHRTGIITGGRFPGDIVTRPPMDHPRHKGGRKKPSICHSKRLIVILWLTWNNWDEARFSGNLDSVYGAFSNEHEIKWIKEAIKQAQEEREKKREKRRKYEEKRAERKIHGEEKEIELMEEGFKQTLDLEALSLAKLIKLSKRVSKSKLCGGERETEKV